MHLDLHRTVVLFKELLDLLYKYSEIMDLSVCSWIGIDTFHIVTVNEPIGIVNTFFFDTESLSGLLDAVVGQPIPVDVVDKSIAKDTKILVQPQSDYVNCFHSSTTVCQAKSL